MTTVDRIADILGGGIEHYLKGGAKYTLRPMVNKEEKTSPVDYFKLPGTTRIKDILGYGTSPCPWADYLTCIPMDEEKIKEVLKDGKKMMSETKQDSSVKPPVVKKVQTGGAAIKYQPKKGNKLTPTEKKEIKENYNSQGKVNWIKPVRFL